jgi:hypothetical protein
MSIIQQIYSSSAERDYDTVLIQDQAVLNLLNEIRASLQ